LRSEKVCINAESIITPKNAAPLNVGMQVDSAGPAEELVRCERGEFAVVRRAVDFAHQFQHDEGANPLRWRFTGVEIAVPSD